LSLVNTELKPKTPRMGGLQGPLQWESILSSTSIVLTIRSKYDTFKTVASKSQFLKLACLVLGFNFLIVLVAFALGIGRYLNYLQPDDARWLDIAQDYSWGEITGYVEIWAAIVLMVIAYRHNRNMIVAFCTGLVTYIVLDDMLMIHDQLRVVLGNIFFQGDTPEARQDLGELVFACLIIIPGLAIMAYSFCKSSLAEFIEALPMLVSIGLFTFFSVFLDQIKQLLEWEEAINDHVKGSLAIIEDGGELMSQGLMLLAAYLLYRMVQPRLA
jgi:hypothetical protein